jgi:hypothetical protein
MLALDLFNTKYERELQEGAVDDLEARRIDTLNDRMQDLLARAKEPAYKKNPTALAALKKQFQQVKDERDSYYKVREAGIPGNVPVEKIPGKEDLLKGRGRTYYEDEVNEDDVEDFIKAGGKITYGKPQKGPRRPGMSLASRHIGGGNDRMKPSRSGRAANTQGKPVVSVEDAEKKNSETAPLDQKLQRLKVQARRQFPRAHTDDEALILKLLDKETQDDRLNRQTDARQDAELRKNFALDREQENEIEDLQTQVGVKEHGGGIGPKQHWQDLMPEQYNDDEDYEDEDQDLRLRSGDYVRDQQDGESGEIFRMQGDPEERRVRILDRDGKGWYIEPSRLTRVDPTDPDVQRYFGKSRQRDMDEAVDEKGALKAAQAAAKFIIRNLDDRAALKYYSQDFWSPEKFYQGATMAMRGVDADEIVKHIIQDRPVQFESGMTEAANVNPQFINAQVTKILAGEARRMTNAPMAQLLAPVIKEYGLTLQQIDGMVPGGLKKAAGEYGIMMKEGWSERALAQRTGQPQTPYGVYIDGKQWKEFATDDQARAVARKLEAKFRADGSNKKVSYAPATSVTNKPVKEDQDSSGVERAILNRIMVAHTDLLMKFGPDKVMQAAEEVAYNVGDVDEIGTSDVSAYVAQVKQILGATP